MSTEGASTSPSSRRYVIHGEQAHEYERPIYVGDVLEGRPPPRERLPARGRPRRNDDLRRPSETEYRTPDGELVLTDRSTAIETEGAIDDGDERARATPRATAARPKPTVAPQKPSRLPTRPSASSSASVPSLTSSPAIPARQSSSKTSSASSSSKYAGASGDFNPIHYDEPFATGAGNESVFGQGMFTAGITSRVVANWFDLRDVSSFGVRFQSRVFPGDTVVATGEVAEIDRDAGTVETELEARTVAGETLLTGTATADLE